MDIQDLIKDIAREAVAEYISGSAIVDLWLRGIVVRVERDLENE